MISSYKTFCIALIFFFFAYPLQAIELSEQEIRILKSLSLDRLPKEISDPSNKISTSPKAIKLGEKLFFDARLSGDGKTACASCHLPQRFYTDGLKTATSKSGTGKISRNTPTLIGIAHNDWFYWDGRRDSLWSQALTPIEAKEEMSGNRLAAVKLILEKPFYKKRFKELFGDQDHNMIHSIQIDQAGPYANSAIRNNWFQLAHSQQEAINRIFSQIGKTIAAYITSLQAKENKLDKFIRNINDEKPESMNDFLSHDQLTGLKLFLDVNKTKCLQCHNGPLLTNGDFHNIGSGNLTGENLDFGREMGKQAVLLDEFNCLGSYSDAEEKDCSAIRFLNRDKHDSDLGAYKTPGLRGLKYTAPYFHDGRFETIEEVINFYVEDQDQTDSEITNIDLNAKEINQLTEFLKIL